MTHYTYLFSPETYESFLRSSRSVAGFRERQRNLHVLRQGDQLVCYVTGVSRWVALLEVEGGPFRDDTPLFSLQNDPYVVRFLVACRVCVPLHLGVPMHDATLWNGLSFTRELRFGSPAWTGKIRGSLNALSTADAGLIRSALTARADET